MRSMTLIAAVALMGCGGGANDEFGTLTITNTNTNTVTNTNTNTNTNVVTVPSNADCSEDGLTCFLSGVITEDAHLTANVQWVLEGGVFIGSDTQLVAPVTVGARATVAAGTTVTQDVPPGALALSRAPQVNREGYDAAYRKPREDAGKKGTS